MVTRAEREAREAALLAACVTVPFGPACVNITGLRAGDANEMTFTLTSGGVPIDLTGLTLDAQARKTAQAPDPPAMTAVIEITDAALGKGVIRWPGAEVSSALAGAGSWSGVWDLQIGDGTGDPVTVVEGTIGAVSDVTRP